MPAAIFRSRYPATVLYQINSATTKGLEMDIRHCVSRAWQTYLNYTFESGSLTESGNTVRNWDLPRHMVRFGADYTHKKFKGNVQGSTILFPLMIFSATAGVRNGCFFNTTVRCRLFRLNRERIFADVVFRLLCAYKIFCRDARRHK